MLVKKDHLDKILLGQKTMTRRKHSRLWTVGKTYRLRRNWYDYTDVKVLVTRRFRQQLGKMSIQDVHKEGYATLEDFKDAWTKINGAWNPYEIVWVYEFKLVKEKKQNGTKAS